MLNSTTNVKEVSVESSLPYVPNSKTSKAAAESMKEYVPTIRDEIYDLFETMGALTCDEVEEILELRHQTASARIRELVQIGLLYDSGLTRMTRSGRKATLWTS